MKKYKLTIQYDGTNFTGWQIQRSGFSIQGEIQNALKILLKESVQLIGAGRTDAGVHALGQVAHFSTDSPLAIEPTLRSLNGILPCSIRILSLQPVDAAFHSRYSAKGKVYHYHLHRGPTHSPFSRLYSHLVREPIDISLLRSAARHFIGTHDFKAFANKNQTGSAGKDSVRTIQSIEVVEKGSEICLQFKGNGFLYKMVRNIVGTLLDVCWGKIALEEIDNILLSKDRRKAGRAISPRGLFLIKVIY